MQICEIFSVFFFYSSVEAGVYVVADYFKQQTKQQSMQIYFCPVYQIYISFLFTLWMLFRFVCFVAGAVSRVPLSQLHV